MTRRRYIKNLQLSSIALLMMLMSACSSAKVFEARLNGWLGVDENQLVTQWGAPDKTYSMEEGKTVMTYKFEGSTMHNYYGGGVGSSTRTGCDVTFVMENRRVYQYTFRGNACGDQLQTNEQIESRVVIGANFDKDSIVVSLWSGFPAEKTGITVGERIVAIDDDVVNGSDDIENIIASHSAGDTVKLISMKDGVRNEYQVKLIGLPVIGNCPGSCRRSRRVR